MPRAIWKGAITFGLVHIPVAVYPASSETGIDFDWLDKRSMDPVGCKRVNKRIGKEVERRNIVRGVKVNGGQYVVLSDEDVGPQEGGLEALFIAACALRTAAPPRPGCRATPCAPRRCANARPWTTTRETRAPDPLPARRPSWCWRPP